MAWPHTLEVSVQFIVVFTLTSRGIHNLQDENSRSSINYNLSPSNIKLQTYVATINIGSTLIIPRLPESWWLAG